MTHGQQPLDGETVAASYYMDERWMGKLIAVPLSSRQRVVPSRLTRQPVTVGIGGLVQVDEHRLRVYSDEFVPRAVNIR